MTEESSVHLISKDAPTLQSIGPQKCLSFSTDGAKFAVGGEVPCYPICLLCTSLFVSRIITSDSAVTSLAS